MEDFVDRIEKRLDTHIEDIQAVKVSLKNGVNINDQFQNVLSALANTKQQLRAGPDKTK